MMFQKFLIALGVCVAVTVGLFYAKENGERSGSRPLGHLWSLFHLFGDQCETNSKTSLTSRPQEVFSSSHQLPCYRIHRRLVIVGREQMAVTVSVLSIFCSFPQSNFILFQIQDVHPPMAVRAKRDGVFDDIRTSFSKRLDMMAL